MIFFTVMIKGRAGKRKEILQTIHGVLDQVKKKEGCQGAKSYQDLNDENIFYLVEEWRTLEDMDRYLRSNLFAVLLGIEPILADKPEVKVMIESSSSMNSRNNERQAVQ